MKVVCVAGHRDDFTCAAGTLCRLSDAGADISYLVTTDSRYDHWVKPTPPMEQVEIIDRETEDFCKVVGVKEFVNFRYEDCFLEVTAELKKRIIRFFRERKPDIVLTCWPDDAHPDHRNTTEMVNHAAGFANRKHYVDGLEASSIRAVYYIEMLTQSRDFVPAYFVDVSKYIDRIAEAYACYASLGMKLDGRDKLRREEHGRQIFTKYVECLGSGRMYRGPDPLYELLS